MGKLKRTIKKAAAIFTAAIMSFSTAVPIYAETNAQKVAVLVPGVNSGTGGTFASKITSLAGSEENVKAIAWSDVAPSDTVETKQMAVTTSGSITSNTGIYGWFDSGSGTIFLYSDADVVYMNKNCSGLLYNYSTGKAFTNLQSVDFGRADWSNVANLSHAFYKCSALQTLDLTKFAGTIESEAKVQNMISESGIRTIKFGSNWVFKYPIGMDGNWTKDGAGPYTSYKIETSGQFGGGTYTRADGDITDDSGEIYQAYGDKANNGWEIHSINDKFTGFCIDADSHTRADYESDPTLTPAAGAGMIYGYYTKEQTDGSKLVNGVSGDHVDASIGYLNSDDYGSAPLGNNLREALITLLYYGPKIYDITTQEGFDNLQSDIWHFTNRYSSTWTNKDKWNGKTFSSIPNHDSYELYVYVSKSGRQNMITTDSIVVPETPTYEVKILKTTNVTGTEKPLAGAKLYLKGPKSYNITSGTKAATLSLPAGDYTLSEVTAPSGYEKADNVSFTVTDEGKVMVDGKEVDQVTMQDAAIKNKITIHKVDERGKVVSGAKLKVTCKSLVIGGKAKDMSFTTNSSDTGVIATMYPGEYTMSEDSAPTGYETAENITFVLGTDGHITVDGKDIGTALTMVDKYVRHTVKISKQDIAGEEIDGAKLTISGDKIDDITFTSSKNAPHSVELPAGTYTLTETTAPKGYAVAEKITFTVDDNGKVTVGDKDVNGTVVMTDRYADTQVNISKQDVGGKEIDGATLRIEGKTVEGKAYTTSFTTDGKNAHTVSLQPGTYTLTETQVPDGYEKAESIVFKVDTNGKVTVNGKEVSQVLMIDQYEKKPVEICKQDIDGKEIAGATLTVTGTTDQGDEITPITIQTDGKTSHKITVYPGTYILTETTVPNGYKKAESIQFVVKADGTIVSGKKNVDKIVMVDKYSGSTIKISKQDIDGNEIAGAKLTITHTENDLSVTDYSWVSEEGKNKEVVLEAGDYVLHETGAPDGYIPASDIEFTVTADGKVKVDGKTSDTVVMTDKFTTVTVSKVDSANTKTYLSGAKLQILNSGKQVVEEWTTDGKAHVVSGVLAVGQKYTLHEVSAPDGYAVADDITFTVTSGAKSVVMKDAALEKETGTLTVRKVDSSNTSTFVSGAQLQLLDASNNVIEEWTTDKKEHVVTANLKKNVTYTLHEASAPSGYDTAADIKFTMTEKNKIVIMKDKAVVTVGKITVLKVKDGDTNTYVSGAKLQILDSSKNVVEEWTTDNSSHVVSAKLVSGQKYTLHEASAPSGYSIASDISFTASTKDQTITMKDKAAEVAGKVTVQKVKEGDTKTYVSGAKLQVLDSSGTVVDSWTTDGSDHVVSGTLKVSGKYTLHEESAPTGYEVASDISFTVTTKDQTITMKDKATPTLTVKKVDEDGKAVVGAKLQILDSNNGIIDSWTTDGTDHVVTATLSKGSYKLHEVSAPDGYEVAEDISFTWTQTETKTITMTDKKGQSAGKTSDSTSTKSSGKSSGNGTSSSKVTKSAATGDASNLPLMAAGAALGITAIGLVLFKKKRGAR